MRTRARSEWFAFPLRVNKIEFKEVSWRPSGDDSTDFEVLVRDGRLGSFALHEDFLLQTRGATENQGNWESISLAELKRAIWTKAQQICADPQSQSVGDQPERLSRGRIERIPVEGDRSHLERAQEALKRSGIQFQIVGGLDGRGQCAGHLTLAVSSINGAGICLRKAGFLQSAESKYVVVDSRTGWKVRLLNGTSVAFCRPWVTSS